MIINFVRSQDYTGACGTNGQLPCKNNNFPKTS